MLWPIIGLLHDDELNPQAAMWLAHYATPAILHDNAYIALMALDIDGNSEPAFQSAKQLYISTLYQIHQGTLDPKKKIVYPKLTKLLARPNDPPFCLLAQPGCFEQLLEHRATIEPQISAQADKLKRLRQIAKLNNFTPLNTIATELNLQLGKLLKLAALQAFYQMERGELEQAASQIAAMFTLERKLRASTTDVTAVAIFLTHFDQIYTPLVERLYQKQFTQWSTLLPSLRPLEMSEIAMNRIWLQQYANDAQALDFNHIAQNMAAPDSPYQQLPAHLIYKPNLTLNALFQYIAPRLIDETLAKKQLIAEVIKNRKASQDAYRKLKSDLQSPTWFMVQNYRNIVGTSLWTTATQLNWDTYTETILIDLKLILLNALIQSQSQPIENIINMSQNPYTGEKPTLHDNQLCFKTPSPVCIKLSRQ